MESNQTNYCLKCGKPVQGRQDKKFCDAYCRNAFNNQNKGPDEHMMKGINQTIRRNRRILKSLSPQGKAVVRRTVLQDLGFNFNYFTSVFRSNQSVYYLCYDYGFRAIIDNGKEKVQIIQQQDYMRDFDPWKLIK